LPRIDRLDLLPYHRLGEPKYQRLAVDYPLQETKTQPNEVVERLKAIVEDYGLRVQIGG
jgi:pyruvate formate lyase activating enzyme